MAQCIKSGISQTEAETADAKVKTTVENILSDIKDRGDVAVRELSDRFDSWSPESFQLSQTEVEELIGRLPRQVIEDIEFAQAQVRNFAQKQREALRDIEVETLPGVTLGHKNIPVNSVGCYVPGGRYAMVASAHMRCLSNRARTQQLRRARRALYRHRRAPRARNYRQRRHWCPRVWTAHRRAQNR